MDVKLINSAAMFLSRGFCNPIIPWKIFLATLTSAR